MNQEIKKIYVRYDELALKKGSRAHFEKKLKKNIARIAGITRGHIERIRGRMVVTVPKDHSGQDILRRLQRCFGICKMSPVTAVEAKIETIYEAAVAMAQKHVAGGARSFKIEARRSNKKFPMKSPEINMETGAVVLDKVPELQVDVHKPDFIIRVEVFKTEAYLFSEDVPGPGGLPTGVGGRSLLLLSGGIDSPVAGYLTQKRGLHVDAVYFHSFPFTGEKTKEKVKDLAAVLGASSPDPLRLSVCSVTHIQKVLKDAVPEAYWTLMLRRFMVRIADQLAQRHGYAALITGDALGQVASQTLENLNCLEGVATRLLLRPLTTYDKNEVIELSRQIETYDLSIQPYPDCCTLFAPSHPVTRGRRDLCERLDAELDVDALVTESIEGLELYKHDKKEGMIRVEKTKEVILEDGERPNSETAAADAPQSQEKNGEDKASAVVNADVASDETT